MSRLPLQTLPAFLAVARRPNLRAASTTLHLTHSALSQQIRLLEEQLGHALFTRSGRRLALNPAGAALLRAVEPALALLDDGVRAAAAAAAGADQRMRVTVLPSFAQRWVLPRMGRWRERHPDIGIELHASQQLVDLRREGFHAGLRQGAGPWPGLVAERLLESPLIALGSPEAARRLLGRDPRAIADEPLLGSQRLWERWFALADVKLRVNPVAAFNDAGLMLQAAEHGLGIALARELLAADALQDGRLVRLSPQALPDERADPYWLVYPENLRDWAPLAALRAWLNEELDRSQQALRALPSEPVRAPAGTSASGPTGSRSRAASAAGARPAAKQRAR